MITSIIAIAKNLAIGKAGKLPWHYPDDLKFFKRTTTGHAIAMGSNTWRSIGRPLPGRLSVVLSRNAEIELPPGVIRLTNKDEVVGLAKYLSGDLYLIGGAAIYKAYADVIDRWIVTYIPEDVHDADTFMPSDFLADFEHCSEEIIGDGLVAKFFERTAKSDV